LLRCLCEREHEGGDKEGDGKGRKERRTVGLDQIRMRRIEGVRAIGYQVSKLQKGGFVSFFDVKAFFGHIE
jgi:hypothetical protein